MGCSGFVVVLNLGVAQAFTFLVKGASFSSEGRAQGVDASWNFPDVTSFRPIAGKAIEHPQQDRDNTGPCVRIR